jgi:hypothetical protein
MQRPFVTSKSAAVAPGFTHTDWAQPEVTNAIMTIRAYDR